MLQKIKDLTGCRLEAVDGEVGKVKDVYFDDHTWRVRYLVVDTGTWLDSREVLVAPASITGFDAVTETVMTRLTREQVKTSPAADSDMPISRHYERKLHAHYGWPYYASGALLPGPGLYMYPPAGDLGIYPAAFGPAVTGDPARASGLPDEAREMLDKAGEDADPHLRSARDVIGHKLSARDGDIGHVEDFLVDADDRGWSITHFVIDTRNWLPGKKVVVDTGVVTAIDWADGHVAVDLTRQEVKDSPAFDADLLIDETFQTQVSSYYRSLDRAHQYGHSAPGGLGYQTTPH